MERAVPIAEHALAAVAAEARGRLAAAGGAADGRGGRGDIRARGGRGCCGGVGECG